MPHKKGSTRQLAKLSKETLPVVEAEAEATGDERENASSVVCDICCMHIEDATDTSEGQDALFCEGECQSWYHRRCVRVSRKKLQQLTASTDPFLCPCCVSQKQQEIILGLQGNVLALNAEVLELKAAVEKLRQSTSAVDRLEGVEGSGSTGKLPWNVVAGGGKRGKRLDKRLPSNSGYRPKGTSNTQRAPPGGKLATSNTASVNGSSERGHAHRKRIPVKGARKVWGTLRSTTTLAVENALKTLTSINAMGLVVKRKFKTARNDERVTKWWFVVRGEESVLEQLQKEWPAISVQTSWRLEPVFIYGDDAVCPPAEQLHIVEQSEQPLLASPEQAVPQQNATHHQPANPSLPASPQPIESTNPSMSVSPLVSQPPQGMEGAHN